MFCPECAQKVTEEVQFCSQCGARVDGVRGLMAAGVSLESARDGGLTPRQAGVRRGVRLMLLAVVLVPAYVLLAALFPARDALVESSPSDTPFEKISQAVLVTLFLLGVARVLYAALLERGGERGAAEEPPRAAELRARPRDFGALPPARETPVPDFGARRARTAELVRPSSVTEETTRSLGERAPSGELS